MSQAYVAHLQPRRIFLRHQHRQRRRTAGIVSLAVVLALPLMFAVRPLIDRAAAPVLDLACIECRPAIVAASSGPLLIDAPRRKPAIPSVAIFRR